ncbi:MAG: DUF2059 domain-containing protein [Rhodobacteraceae bacterium]|jgi:hypothetical protein|nr:DUF2059 domain-containing protein [Paracoccaceae bacterium]
MTVLSHVKRGVLAMSVGFVTLCAVLSVPVHAADRDRLEAFLAVTGFDVALDSIGLAAGSAPAMLGMQPNDFGSDWSDQTREVFDPVLMQDMALSILEKALSDDLLTHAAAFYASDLGQRLVEAENASHMVEDDVAKQSEGAGIVARWQNEDDPRLDLLQRLNKAIDSADTAVRAVQEIQLRFLMAASNSGVLEGRIDEATLRARLKESTPQLRRSLEQSGLAAAAYTYQNFSKEDLAGYLAALEHPDMQKVYELMNGVQFEIMANRFEALAAKMADMHPGQEL